MEVIIRPTAADAVKLTARLIADAICEKPDLRGTSIPCKPHSSIPFSFFK